MFWQLVEKKVWQFAIQLYVRATQPATHLNDDFNFHVVPRLDLTRLEKLFERFERDDLCVARYRRITAGHLHGCNGTRVRTVSEVSYESVEKFLL